MRLRRYTRRRSLFKFKLRKETIYTIFSLLLIFIAILLLVSFSRGGELLVNINNVLIKNFGWGALFFPINILLIGLLFTRLRLAIAHPNVAIGFSLLFLSFLGLTSAGIVGESLWINLEILLSAVGAFFVLLLGILVGVVVLFNTSIDQIFKFAVDGAIVIAGWTNSRFLPFFKKKPKPLFVKDNSKIQGQMPLAIREPQKEKKAVGKKMPDDGLGSAIVANLPTESGIWEYPSLSLLSDVSTQKADRGDVKQNAAIIEKTLQSFGVAARVSEVNLGPAVTQYTLEIALGTKLSKITALSNDLALALAAPTGQIRIEAPIPGRSLVGIEIPNRTLEFVTLKTMLASNLMQNNKGKLIVALGLDVSGNPVIADIARMPHTLIAGTTGSGKSVLINSFITSLLFRTTPNEVKLILIDPKRVELTGYNNIPHLLTPVIVEVDKILSALKWAMSEMDRRYKLFAEVGVRNVNGYNELSGFQALPYIVIFIDELADLMAYAPVEVEDAIARLAQMARATGIHLVVSTQRPSVDVLTGLIKANIPCRIAFNVSSMVDSRVIIDTPGAEKLLGRGDMLYIPPDQAKPTRIQGTYVSENEVKKLVDYLRSKGIAVEYTEEVVTQPVTLRKAGEKTEGRDDLFEEAVRIVCQYDRASASLLQRRLSVGYARAARIIDQLEMEGIIGPGEGAKPRDVLMTNAQEYLNREQPT
ncbi:DNA translocase FtsK [Candidatus Microgenomates bacterium]|nr:DNA translocase FtsK [Candidatus Microgenomates bacterium]